jgi:hypothetical protein
MTYWIISLNLLQITQKTMPLLADKNKQTYFLQKQKDDTLKQFN